jgi:membrane-bound lytic murein transglycosylase MltF
MFKAQGLAESGLDADARSRTGARGIMQLMPSTFELLQPRARGLQAIHDPVWNIVAGLRHDRAMWVTWPNAATPLDRRRFMFASYNAGSRTIARAWRVARVHHLDPNLWASIERIAARVWRWRERQTLLYLRKIEAILERLDDQGRVAGRRW